MKKLIALLLVLVLALSLVACGSKEETKEEVKEEISIASSLEVLENIWAMYGDDEKFAIMGGNPEAGIMDAPGVYDMAYAENLTYNLLIPAEQLANVDEAATMIHMKHQCHI